MYDGVGQVNHIWNNNGDTQILDALDSIHLKYCKSSTRYFHLKPRLGLYHPHYDSMFAKNIINCRLAHVNLILLIQANF